MEKKTINSISELPNGVLLTGKNGRVKISDSDTKFVAAYQLSGSVNCWVLSTIEGERGHAKLQLLKKLREQSLEVDAMAMVQDGILKVLYESDEKKAEEINEVGSLKDSPVVKEMYKLMELAYSQKASDVHIEKRQEYAGIKIRKHGEIVKLKGYETISQKAATDLCTVAYNVMAEPDSIDVNFNDSLIQQGAIKMNLEIKGKVHEVKLRFQSIPVYPNGFDVVMRVLSVSKDEDYTSLEMLGYETSQIKLILECVSKSTGAVIIAGVTGSGKSTTLKNLLMWLNEDRGFSEKIFTVEDPPEYVIPHVSQIPVKNGKDDKELGKKPFEDAIKACMRGDPDLIMVGEIRDGSTGDLLKKAVQSGHRVLSTIHAPSPLGVIERLVDFNLSLSTLSSQDFLAGIMYQRLMAELCPKCSKPLHKILESSKAPRSLMEINKRIEKAFKAAKEVDYGKYMTMVRVRGSGCDFCDNGVVGRTVCAEVLKPDLKILECIQKQDLLKALSHLRDTVSDQRLTTNNMIGKSAMAHAFYKMINGRIDPIELERAFGIISYGEIRGMPELDSQDYKEETFVF